MPHFRELFAQELGSPSSCEEGDVADIDYITPSSNLLPILQDPKGGPILMNDLQLVTGSICSIPFS